MKSNKINAEDLLEEGFVKAPQSRLGANDLMEQGLIIKERI